jgi:hypothetical protein
MSIFALVVSLLVSAPQAQAANPACSMLTAAEAASIIGTANPLPVGSSPRGTSCMLQKGDAFLTVLVVKLETPDSAQGLFTSKKRIVAGTDVPGWTTPAYSGVIDNVAVVGVLKGSTFVEVKAMDKTQKTDALGAKLLGVMKAVAGRM